MAERITSLWPGRRPRRRSALTLALALALALFIGAGLSFALWQDALQSHAQRLPAVAASRAKQVGAWVGQVRREASYLQGSQLMRRELAQLLAKPSPQLQAQMATELQAFARAAGFGPPWLGDRAGRSLLPGEAAALAPVHEQLVQRALQTNQLLTGPLGGAGARPGELALAVPLATAEGPPSAVLLLRLDAPRALAPLIGRWPLPSRSARLRLWEQQRTELIPLQWDAAAAPVRLAQDSSPQPVARVLRGELPYDKPHWGLDEQGTPVFMAVAQVPGMPWLLSAQVDREEVLQPLRDAAPGVLALAVAALAATVLAGALLRQRGELSDLQRDRQAQAERLRAVATLQGVARASRDAIFAKDLQGRYVLWNEAAEAMTGIGAQLALGRRDDELFPAEVAGPRRQDDEVAPASGETRTTEETLHSPLGPRNLSVTKGPLRDEFGHVVGVFGIARDVTDTRQALEALRLSQERLSLALQASITGVWELDLATGDYLWSEEIWRMVGRTPPPHGPGTPVPGALVQQGVVPEDRARVQEELDRAVTLRTPFRSEFRICRDDGSQRWVLDLGRLVYDSEGRPTRMIGTTQDVTERKRAEGELEQHRHHLQQLVADRTRELDKALQARQASEHFLRMVADILPSAVSYWNAERRCLFANRSYAQQFQCPPEDLVGRLDTELLRPDRLALNDPLVRRALAGEETDVEYPERGPDGQLLRCHIARFLPDVRDGVVHGYLFLASDVTTLRRAQDQVEEANAELLRARNRAEAADRAKGAFLANMSHEIRTPLNAITGMAHLLQRDAKEPQVSERAAKVADAAQHLLSLVNDVLDLSKIEAGKLTLEEMDFSLEALLARAMAMVGDAARAKGLELVVNRPPEIDALRGDATRLLQTLVNLLGNAVKFTAQGWVSLRVEAQCSDSDGTLLKFSVQDTGIGIAPQQLNQLFEAFAQADSSNTRRYGGTGLGLAISRRLAQMMSGEIGATSKPGQGSTFWFTARLRWGLGQALPEPPAALLGRRVLLVDDLPDACEALATLLRALGLRVDTATTGTEALHLARAARAAGEHHDLALVDWRMPGPDSSALAAQLRELDPALHMVLLTAYDEPAMWRTAQGGGYQQVLVKPVASRALHDTLLRLFQLQAADADAALPDANHGPNAQRLRTAHQGARVLVAEDNAISMEVLSSLLESCALTVLPAADGEQAVALAEQELVDLILMDLNMPGLDGLSAVRAIRRLPQHAHTPVLAVTANAFEDDRQAALAAGMNGHIAKPIDAEELFGQLLRWLPDSTRKPQGQGLGQVQAAAMAETQPAAEPPPPALDAALVARLRALLSAGDYAAVDLWRELAPAMGAHHGEQARQLGQAISRFAYAQAQHQLDALSPP